MACKHGLLALLDELEEVVGVCQVNCVKEMHFIYPSRDPGKTVSKLDVKEVRCSLPVWNGHRPFFCRLCNGHPYQLQRRFVVRENPTILNPLT